MVVTFSWLEGTLGNMHKVTIIMYEIRIIFPKMYCPMKVIFLDFEFIWMVVKDENISNYGYIGYIEDISTDILTQNIGGPKINQKL